MRQGGELGSRQMKFAGQEDAMTEVIKRNGSRMARWFKKATKRKTAYRWYDVEHCGM
jgi:hypothetical protein